jgi:hypothetical protein
MVYAVEQEELKCLKMQRDKEVNVLRTEDALETQTDIIAAGCPFVIP